MIKILKNINSFLLFTLFTVVLLSFFDKYYWILKILNKIYPYYFGTTLFILILMLAIKGKKIPVVIYLISIFFYLPIFLGIKAISIYDQSWIFDILTSFYHYYIGFSILSFVIVLIVKDYSLLPIIIIIAILSYIPIHPYIHKNQEIVPSRKPLNIMFYNVLSSNQSYQKTVNLIKKHSPDIFIVAEINNLWLKKLEQLNKLYPYSYRIPKKSNFGIALYSKIKIKSSKTINLILGEDIPFIISKFDLLGRTYKIIGVHTLPPIGKNLTKIRDLQLKKLKNYIDKDTIIIGDFNITPFSTKYSDFVNENYLQDARLGHGISPSWHSLFIYIPIDHAFVGNNIDILNFKVLNEGDSDHFPIIVQIQTRL